MNNKQLAYQVQAESMIKKLEQRNMTGHYFPTSNDLISYLKETFPQNATITYGGSESIKEAGVMDLITSGTYEVLHRVMTATKEEQRAFYAKQVLADYYLMSTNAITLDGELINIDGNSNRVGCLVHGPEHVFLIVGMNKVVADVESGIKRIRNIATPPNGIRLNKKTPCALTGKCGNCFSPECMCNQIVITRRSGHTGRIHVFLIGEELGF